MGKYFLCKDTFYSIEELYHHGVKGMKWGVRRTPKQLRRKTKFNKRGTLKDYKRTVTIGGRKVPVVQFKGQMETKEMLQSKLRDVSKMDLYKKVKRGSGFIDHSSFMNMSIQEANRFAMEQNNHGSD